MKPLIHRRGVKKNFTLVFHEAQDQHLGKDICIIPNYLAEDGRWMSYLACGNKGQKFLNKAKLAPNLEIIFFTPSDKTLVSQNEPFVRQALFVANNAYNIDVLQMCHFSTLAKISAIIYKFINRKGKVWIKMDVSKYSVEKQFCEMTKGGLHQKLIHVLNRFALRSVDILSVESSEGVTWVQRTYSKETKKIHHIPNPINTPLIRSLGFPHPKPTCKENVIITVARIGTEQKNNEMMLDALSGMDMRNWKFVLIGSIEAAFIQKIEKFYSENPSLKESVYFTGPIEDKQLLYSWYNRAQVFCLTSRAEGFCNAQVDALYFGLYNISTPISGIEDIGDRGRLACIVNSVEELKQALSKIFNQDVRPIDYMDSVIAHSQNYFIENLCQVIAEKIEGN